jgi:hypothetical protein
MPIMKRKLTLGSGVGEDVVLEWSIGENTRAKRLGVDDTSSESSGSEGLGDEAHTIWLLQYAATLREKTPHMCGAREQSFGAPIELEEEVSHGYALKRSEVVTQYNEVKIRREFDTQRSGSALSRR